ncbi:MAG TPA: ABC transporter substrate-binding protein, partial [Candidatus Binatus sp.]|nr:ABC transporter substrate-binding protein [Candidatus Binatus sp.]
MGFLKRRWIFSLALGLIVYSVTVASSRADDVVLMAYGGHNETIGPYWVAIDKGIYLKHGIDARLLQVRNAQISLTALISGEVPIFLPSVANVLSGVSAGAKLGCVAFPIKGISRELMVRKEIDSLTALRGKIIGVQSIGGGFWLQTMMVLDGVGVDPDKLGMKMRVIGEEPTIVQALLSSNIDAAVVTLPAAAAAKRGGMRSLVNSGDLRIALQTVGLCGRQERFANTTDLTMRLTKGMIDALVYILDPHNKRDVAEIMKKHLRLSSDEDAETSYNSLRSISSLEIAPDPIAWKNVQRFTVRVNPKVAQIDVNESINLS